MDIKKIVICDDEPGLRELIANHLSCAGYTVIEASDGQEALKAIKRYDPNLILLDLKMPRLSGIDVLMQLAQADIKIPTIVLSGVANESKIDLANFEIEKYISKPFTLSYLSTIVNKILS